MAALDRCQLVAVVCCRRPTLHAVQQRHPAQPPRQLLHVRGHADGGGGRHQAQQDHPGDHGGQRQACRAWLSLVKAVQVCGAGGEEQQQGSQEKGPDNAAAAPSSGSGSARCKCAQHISSGSRAAVSSQRCRWQRKQQQRRQVLLGLWCCWVGRFAQEVQQLFQGHVLQQKLPGGALEGAQSRLQEVEAGKAGC